MKKKYILVNILLFFSVISFSQEIDMYLIPENVETFVGNTEHIFLDPVLVDDVADFPGITATEDRFNNHNDDENDIADSEDFFTSFDIDVEFGWSKTAKFVNLPLSYFYKDFEFSLVMPFYLQRQVFYSHGYVSATGLGDLLFSASWKYRTSQVFNRFITSMSFPTGNQNKNVNGYLCPLGTGSYDVILSNQFQLNKPNYSINSILTYRYSGKSERSVIISYPDFYGIEQILFNLSNGHTILLNSSYNRYITNYLSVFGGVSLMHNASGKLNKEQTFSWNSDIIRTEGVDPFQEFFVADVKLAVSATVFATDIVFVLSQPVYTWRKTDNIEGTRKMSYYIKLSRNIF
jgi:hypothetical protein